MDKVYDFTEWFARIKKDLKWWWVNKKGDMFWFTYWDEIINKPFISGIEAIWDDEFKKFNFIDKDWNILLNEWVKIDPNLEIIEYWLSWDKIAIKFLNKEEDKVFYIFKTIK